MAEHCRVKAKKEIEEITANCLNGKRRAQIGRSQLHRIVRPMVQ